MKEKYSKLRSANERRLMPATGKPRKKKIGILKTVYATLQIAFYVASGAIIGGELGQAVTSGVKSSKKVWKEAEALEVDTDIISLYGGPNNFVKGSSNKFPYNKKEPIYVSYSDKISSEDKALYEKALNHYEELFETIDSRYKFKEVSQTEAYMRRTIGQSVILFDEKSLGSFVQGYAQLKPNVFRWDVVGKGKVGINTNLNDYQDAKYSVILHEIAHIFGLGDGNLYSEGLVQSDSFMYASDFNSDLGMLYPNDIKLFHLLYNRNLSNKDGSINQNEVDKINDYIKEYEVGFYDKVAQVLQEKATKTSNTPIPLDIEELQNTTLLHLYIYYADSQFKKGQNKMSFDLENNKINYQIIDSDNKVVYETEADIIVKNNIVFIPSLTIKSGLYPEMETGKSNPTGDIFLGIFKSEDGFMLFNFGTSQRYTLKQLTPETKLTKGISAYKAPQTPLYKIPTNMGKDAMEM